MNNREKNYKIILLIASIIAFFSNLSLYDVEIMECRNFIAAREIIENNNWLMTTLNGDYRFEKPPLPTWSVAAVMKLTGNMNAEWLMRIPAAILITWLVFLMYKFIKRLSGDAFLGFLTAFIFSSSFMLMKEGVINTWDIFSYGFIFASIVYLTEGIKKGDKKNFLKFALCFACSLLSKGPVAPYAMLLPFFIAYGIVYGVEEYKKNKWLIGLSLLVGIFLAFLWPLYIISNNGELFFKVMSKEKQTWGNRAVKGIFFYFDYFIYTGGWCLFLIYSFFSRSLRKKINLKESNILKMSIIWSGICLILISVVKMKKTRYGLPLYIIAPIPTGVLCSYLYKTTYENLTNWDKKILKIQDSLMKIALVGVPIFILIIEGFKLDLKDCILIVVHLLFLGIYFFILKKYKKEIVKISIIGTGILMLLINVTLIEYFDKEIAKNHQDKNVRLLKSLSTVDKGMNIYSNDFIIEDVWKVGRKIIDIDRVKNEQEKIINLPSKILFLAKDEKNLEELKNYQNIKDYKIENHETFYRNSVSKKQITLYEITLIK